LAHDETYLRTVFVIFLQGHVKLCFVMRVSDN